MKAAPVRRPPACRRRAFASLALPAAATRTRSERLDAIVTHRVWGLLLFLGVMFLVFNLVQNVSAPFLDWIDSVISGPVTRWLMSLLTWVQAPAWLSSLVLEGIVAGVGGVLVFVPGLLVMYLALGLLESSGYLPRAALVMDRVMRAFGLQG